MISVSFFRLCGNRARVELLQTGIPPRELEIFDLGPIQSRITKCGEMVIEPSSLLTIASKILETLGVAREQPKILSLECLSSVEEGRGWLKFHFEASVEVSGFAVIAASCDVLYATACEALEAVIRALVKAGPLEE